MTVPIALTAPGGGGGIGSQTGYRRAIDLKQGELRSHPLCSFQTHPMHPTPMAADSNVRTPKLKHVTLGTRFMNQPRPCMSPKHGWCATDSGVTCILCEMADRIGNGKKHQSRQPTDRQKLISETRPGILCSHTPSQSWAGDRDIRESRSIRIHCTQ